MHFIPGLNLRTSPEAEIVGIDEWHLGEHSYDYVALDPHLRIRHVEEEGLKHTSEPVAESVSSGSAGEPSALPAGVVGNEKAGGDRRDV